MLENDTHSLGNNNHNSKTDDKDILVHPRDIVIETIGLTDWKDNWKDNCMETKTPFVLTVGVKTIVGTRPPFDEMYNVLPSTLKDGFMVIVPGGSPLGKDTGVHFARQSDHLGAAVAAQIATDLIVSLCVAVANDKASLSTWCAGQSGLTIEHDVDINILIKEVMGRAMSKDLHDVFSAPTRAVEIMSGCCC